MDFYFFDTSAFVKNYIDEIGTNWVRNIFQKASSSLIYVVSISEVEAVSAFSRRLKGGNLTKIQADLDIQQVQADFKNEFRIIEITPNLLANAVNLAKTHTLRGYDAVQLSAAIEIYAELDLLTNSSSQKSFIFVSADSDLNTAAEAEGLTVENPNNYP